LNVVKGGRLANDGAATADGSLDAAIRAHRDWLVRRIALVVGDAEEAQDLAQETLARLAKSWPLPDPSGVRRWLATVGLRLAIDERRRRRRWGFLEMRDHDATWAMTTDPDLWRALETLEPRTRAGLILSVLDGYSQDDAAAMLGVPRGTLASWLSRARDRLRPILEERVP
jgi:RNA polymerase sigma-70 factor (ECF subfamily)